MFERLLTKSLPPLAAATLAALALPQERATDGAPVAIPATAPAPGPEIRATLWWGDMDGDGLDDAYAVQPDGGGRLLANRGAGRFEDVTALVGLADASGAHMATWADADGDGRLDLYLPAWRGASRLFVQTEEGAFVDETEARGLPLYAEPVDARWRDVDGDRHLDLWLTTLVDDLLYRNDGAGRFEKLDLGLTPRVLPVARPPATVDEARGQLGLPAVAAGGTGNGPFAPPPPPPASSPVCVAALMDQANPASCLVASSAPTLGQLYTLSSDLFVEAATGRVGVNTTTPSAQLDVQGSARFSGQARFDSQLVSNTSAAPFVISSQSKVENLNVDLLDGLDSADFAVLPIDSSGILDGALVDADVSPVAAIQGTKIAPNFGDQEIETEAGKMRIGPYPPGGWFTQYEIMVTGLPNSDSWDSTAVHLYNDGDADGIQASVALGVRDEPEMQAWLSSGQSLEVSSLSLLDLSGENGVVLNSSQSSVFVDDDLEVSGMVRNSAYGTIELGDPVHAQGGVAIEDYLDVGGDAVVHGNVNVGGTLSSSTGALVVADDLIAHGASFGDGTSSPWEARGLSYLVGTTGYLGVQGSDNFDGETTLDIPGYEIGVLGISTGASVADNVGVYGHSNRAGVRGESSYKPTVDWAELGTVGYGVVASGDSVGVLGQAFSALGGLDGVRGDSDVTGGYGVYGWHKGTTGASRGVVGQTSASGGDAVTAYGDFAGTGAKYFVQPHPTDPTKEVRMVCLEGNESGTYFRGTAVTLGGFAEIEVPEVFRLTTAAEGLTVQVTPVGAPAALWIESRDLERIVVRSNIDVEFDYFVNGVRRGFEDLGERLVRENRSFLPTEPGVPFGTQYPAGVRRMLVDNGILNADFTPNESTLVFLEATLEEYRARRADLAAQRAAEEAAANGPGVEAELEER